MCGIFGAIKQDRRRIDMGVLRALAIVNRERGKESLGFFDSTGEIYKKADDPIDVLAKGECTEWLDRAEQEAWFVVGHTRYSTRGAVCDENSHPFEYGDVIGSHNGILDAPMTYKVDSEYAIDLLNQHKSDYQKALENEWGYWTLAWYDKRKKELFVTMHDNMCGIVKYRGCWYFSSDPDHLSTALGVRDTVILKSGQTVSFDSSGRIKWRKKFSPIIEYSYKRDYRTSGYSSSGYMTPSTNYSDNWDNRQTSIGATNTRISDPTETMKNYDEEFRQIWEEYTQLDEA